MGRLLVWLYKPLNLILSSVFLFPPVRVFKKSAFFLNKSISYPEKSTQERIDFIPLIKIFMSGLKEPSSVPSLPIFSFLQIPPHLPHCHPCLFFKYLIKIGCFAVSHFLPDLTDRLPGI